MNPVDTYRTARMATATGFLGWLLSLHGNHIPVTQLQLALLLMVCGTALFGNVWNQEWVPFVWTEIAGLSYPANRNH